MNIEWKTSAGLVDYPDALEFMENRVNGIIDGKEPEMIWFVEHPPVYTAGTSSKKDELLDKNKFPVYETGRGGKYTYHGPGQRVAYIMLDLKKRMKEPDLRKYVNLLEQCVIDTLDELGIKGERRNDRIGIWVVNKDKTEAKIAALGIRVRKWVSYHGIAINLNPDLSHFNGIVPCGINQHGVTSINHINKLVSKETLDKALKKKLEDVFAATSSRPYHQKG